MREGECISIELKRILGHAAYNNIAQFETVQKMAFAIRYMSTQMAQLKIYIPEENIKEANDYISDVRIKCANMLKTNEPIQSNEPPILKQSEEKQQ